MEGRRAVHQPPVGDGHAGLFFSIAIGCEVCAWGVNVGVVSCVL